MSALRGIYFTGLLFLGALSLTSCRFGNQVVKPPGTQAAAEALEGFFETDPQSLKVCATTETTKCADISTTRLPDMVGSVLSNPVYFQIKYPDTGESFFQDPFGNGAKLPIYVDNKGTLSFLGGTPAEVLWTDTACTTKMFVEENGQLSFATETRIVTKGEYALRMSGRIDLKIQVIITFDGECKDTLQAMYNCYDNADQCGASTDADNKDRHTVVQSRFNYYIKQGVMAPQDILTLSNLAYDVSYQ
ncbi:hypothetical protein WDW86_00875 [Bdellovibrionota bacterium FG-2]